MEKVLDSHMLEWKKR